MKMRTPTLCHNSCSGLLQQSPFRLNTESGAWDQREPQYAGFLRTKCGCLAAKCAVRATPSGRESYQSEENDHVSEELDLKNFQVKDEKAMATQIAAKKETMGKEGIMLKLKRYGLAGVLSYGILNTVYYLGTFLFAWFVISPAPGGLGYRAAAERFIKLFALVWAGSQVTKVLRAGCALALAPAIDHGLTLFTNHFKFKSRGQAFGMIVASCFGLAFILFLIMTFLWA